ncbi:MAG TPA: dCTP deaminase [Planctomycetes bacterium]|nr:dCTP deaminase [Planctomycetota bacterium]
MLMRDIDIKKSIDSGKLGIKPYELNKVESASYDLSVGGEAMVSDKEEKIILSEGTYRPLRLEAGDFALVLTREYIKMPPDIAGQIGMRSSLARKGLILLAGMQIDPGFEGHLRFGLYNASPRTIFLDFGDPLCTIELHQLTGPVKNPKKPIPELIEGKIPKEDRDFLRALETTSLSGLDKSVQSLVISVETLTKTVNHYLVPAVTAILIALIVAVIQGIMK